MPLVKCPDCLKDVSDRSNVCTHCGAPLLAKLIITRREDIWLFTINRDVDSVDNLVGKIMQEMVQTSEASDAKTSQFPMGQVPRYLKLYRSHSLYVTEKSFRRIWRNQFLVRIQKINQYESEVLCLINEETSREYFIDLAEKFEAIFNREAPIALQG